jgi:integrase
MARTAKPWFNKQKNCWMVWLDGKRVKLAEGKKNKKAATDRYDELRFQASHNPHPDDPGQTVASVIDTYQGFARERLAGSTVTSRDPYLQSFAEAHGWRTIADCKPLHMEQWLLDHPEWMSDWTKSSALRNVQACFNWAAKKRLIERNPFHGVTHRGGEPRRNLTDEEFQAILRSTTCGWKRRKPSPGARFRQFLIFLRYTGCRPCEARELTWQCVDFERKLIVIKQHKTARMQKEPKPRLIPIHPVVEKLLRVVQRRGEGNHVFVTWRKTPWDRHTLGHRLRRARDKAGVPADVKLYGVRHAFGTRAIMVGVDIKTVSELMGHTTTRMTEHYLHLAGQHGHLADAMRRVNAPRPGA